MAIGTASRYADAVLEPTGPTIETDIVIVGSGMGGATAAWALRASGLKVHDSLTIIVRSVRCGSTWMTEWAGADETKPNSHPTRTRIGFVI